MNKKHVILFISTTFGFFLCGCPSDPSIPLPGSLNPGRKITVSGPYLHRATGVVFPEEFIPFERVSIWEYDDTGDNIGIGYNFNSLREPTILTIYLYPGPPLQGPGGNRFNPQDVFEQHYKEVLLTILLSHKNPTILSEGPFTLSQAGRTLAGKRAIVQFREEFAGYEQDCASFLYLFYDSSRFLKYRVTCPAAAFELAQESVERFIRDFPILPKS